MKSGHTPHQFAITRILLGAYLTVHFIQLLAWAPELFSAAGMLPDPSIMPSYSFFPNILNLLTSPLETQIFVAILGVLSVLFTAGFYRRPISLILWFGWACLFNRNVFIANPGLPYIGWLLLAFALIPSGEPWSINKRRDDWQMQPLIFWGAWVLMALGYSVSGIHKLWSPSWVDGTALHYVLTNPLARDNFVVTIMLAMPPFVLKLVTWAMLSFEILFAPLCIVKRTRPLIWFAMIMMQLGILTTINFADLTIGILMIHLFTIDPRWSFRKSAQDISIVFFDGVCGLCNGFIDFLILEDRDMRLRVAPLQGTTAQSTLHNSLVEKMGSVVFYENGEIYTKSDAVLRIALRVGGMWSLAVIFFAVPRFLRNIVYDFIAKHRYQWFGKHETCRLPTPKEREYFLP